MRRSARLNTAGGAMRVGLLAVRRMSRVTIQMPESGRSPFHPTGQPERVWELPLRRRRPARSYDGDGRDWSCARRSFSPHGLRKSV
jgi:hypothetical protein